MSWPGFSSILVGGYYELSPTPIPNYFTPKT
jgi:hypothetical protein